MFQLKCPVCGAALLKADGAVRCRSGHSYDIAAKGYVNLLPPDGGNKTHGDSADMLRARRSFLSKGYYEPLSNKINELALDILADKTHAAVLDCCCGEGYYTERLYSALEGGGIAVSMAGFDISKKAAAMASHKGCPITYMVAGVFDIPVPDDTVDLAVHSFAPFCPWQVRRVIKRDGFLLGVVPGRRHLMGLKEILYEKPYENDESGYECDEFRCEDTVRLSYTVTVAPKEDIHSLFLMTPYFWRTPREAVERLKEYDSVETPVEFVIKKLRAI